MPNEIIHTAPATEIPANAAVETLGATSAPTAHRSNIAAKPARKPARKLTGKAVKPAAAKPGKPAAASKPAADKPREIHALANSYRGASPVFRGHERKLSPIVLGRIAARYTDRDHAALKALYAKYGTNPFPAFDTDRGIISRLEAHKLLRHVGGDLSLRDCRFAVTALAEKTRLTKAAAPKA